MMTIGGTAAGAREHCGVVDPAAGQVFAQAPVCTREQLDQAMAAARCALPQQVDLQIGHAQGFLRTAGRAPQKRAYARQ